AEEANSPPRPPGGPIASHEATACRCSRVSPCSASTPMITKRSPAPLGEPVRLGDVVDVDADHGFTQAAGDLGEHVGVVVERGGLDDRGGALRRVAGLE